MKPGDIVRDRRGGIAFYVRGHPKITIECTHWDYEDENPGCGCDEEPETMEDTSRVECVMVGDDRVFTYDVDDLTPLDEDDYCHSCGQIGCTADGRELNV